MILFGLKLNHYVVMLDHKFIPTRMGSQSYITLVKQTTNKLDIPSMRLYQILEPLSTLRTMGLRSRLEDKIFQEMICKHDIKPHVSAPRRPNENPAEAGIRELKRRWYRLQSKLNVPDRLWDYGLEYVSETGNLMVNSSRYSVGRTPLEIVTGETPDLSEYMDFGFYDWIVFRTNAGMGELELGRWLGVSHRVGQMMSY